MAKIWRILLTALSIYLVGALIYGLLFSAQWQAMTGFPPEKMAAEGWRMALSPIPPILMAFGFDFLLDKTQISRWDSAAKLGASVAILILIAGRAYNFVYGIEVVGVFLLDAAHLLLDAIIACVVLSQLRATKSSTEAAG